ncbi:hypothetical protein [Nocardia brevicatena]|uniref:hypothetical protein n=1 Tax=Nocardia brevicatena TaxID=37327 RepID=UPI000304E793
MVHARYIVDVLLFDYVLGIVPALLIGARSRIATAAAGSCAPPRHRRGRRSCGMVTAAAASAVPDQWPTVATTLIPGAAGYGIGLVAGLQEIERVARPDDLTGLTAVSTRSAIWVSAPPPCRPSSTRRPGSAIRRCRPPARS